MAIGPAIVRRRLLTQALFRGGAVMHLLAFTVQPTLYLKRMSMRRGFMGPSTAWTIIGAVVYGSSFLNSKMGKTTETIDVSRLGTERFMHITTAKPMTPGRRRKMRRQGLAVPTLKEQKAYGRLWAANADAAKRAP